MEQGNNLMDRIAEPMALSVEQKVGIGLLLAVSVAVFALLIPWIVARLRRSREVDEGNRSRTFSGFWVVPACLAGALGVFLYAIWYYRKCAYPLSGGGMNALEAVVGSLLKTLRIFGLEEEYPDIIGMVKEMMAELASPIPILQVLAEIYISLLMILAPLVGGAILLEFISNIFPAVKLWTAQLRKKRDICYFSELNPASLALAKSVSRYYVESKKKKKPILVFTDCYVDRENEKEYEIMLEARKEGAICIRDDLAHVAKRRGGKSSFYLMDENEFGNLKALVNLTDKKNEPYIKNAEIYLFVQSDAYVQIEENIMKRLPEDQKEDAGEKEKRKKPSMTQEEFPLIVPIFSYRNLVHNLLSEVPLYEPLIGKKNAAQLTVTIFGNGRIGTEAFLSTYWMGQMLVGKNLEPCALKIRVVSREDEAAFWSKIDYINPEIRRTTDKNEDQKDPILCWGPNGEKNPVYCSVEYIQKDVKNGGFWNSLSDDSSDPLMSTDYFIVALGSDSDNIAVANKLRCSVGKYHLEHPEAGNTVIAYAVFDDRLCRTLNLQKHFCSRNPNEPDMYMHAFGSLEQVYSCENIYMSRIKVCAEEMGDAYMQIRGDSGYIAENKNRRKNADKNYSYWADVSRALHLKYKVFPLIEAPQSVFSCTTEQECETKHRAVVREACSRFKKFAILRNCVAWTSEEDQRYWQELERKKHRLAWLEHRRWNAFTRTMGYRNTGVMGEYYALTQSHKNMPLKLHPCLVESRFPELQKDAPYYQAIDAAGNDIQGETLLTVPYKKKDTLDEVSCSRAKEHKKHCPNDIGRINDFKMYDYYVHEFEEYLAFSGVPGQPELTDNEILAWCEAYPELGAIYYEDIKVLAVPKDSEDDLKKVLKITDLKEMLLSKPENKPEMQTA